jgi:hypothetical protein
MSYDAGGLDAPARSPTGYDPRVAYDAYRSLYSGKIAMGIEVANEAWGQHVISLDKVRQLAAYIKPRGGNGMMLWVSALVTLGRTSSETCGAWGEHGCMYGPAWLH